MPPHARRDVCKAAVAPTYQGVDDDTVRSRGRTEAPVLSARHIRICTRTRARMRARWCILHHGVMGGKTCHLSPAATARCAQIEGLRGVCIRRRSPRGMVVSVPCLVCTCAVSVYCMLARSWQRGCRGGAGRYKRGFVGAREHRTRLTVTLNNSQSSTTTTIQPQFNYRQWPLPLA